MRVARWAPWGMAGVLAALLSGCGAVPAGRPPAHAPVHVPAPRPGRLPPTPARPAPTVQSIKGLEGVISANAESLTRLFGAPRLDVREEDARKLQWSGTACILDVYLYPPQSGGAPTATYVDARRGDGREVDRAACVAAMKRP